MEKSPSPIEKVKVGDLYIYSNRSCRLVELPMSNNRTFNNWVVGLGLYRNSLTDVYVDRRVDDKPDQILE